ncbi:hypothetical protein [Foetidibacter luteolus]|uniref:hypothetical protein n=1 Tax=Foetidibacter luteolus TaxID=2608880 RepID=UPI00129A3F32|nr:hypothetical protein [Foetidibacter luteolus]
MERQRKIQAVVTRTSFKEAEEADDIFWANATEEERLRELISLRMMVFGSKNVKQRIQKVVTKRSLYEEETD